MKAVHCPGISDHKVNKEPDVDRALRDCNVCGYPPKSLKQKHSHARQLEVITSSRLNNTPPIGAPKATDTPAAAAADKTCNPNRKLVLE
jgi:hypothetical protein